MHANCVFHLCDPVPCLIVTWGFLCYSTKCISLLFHQMHTETHWKKYPLNLLIQKEMISLFKRVMFLPQYLYSLNGKLYPHNVFLNFGRESRKVTTYWKLFVCYIISPNIFCSVSELLYFSICWNDGFHTFCFVK